MTDQIEIKDLLLRTHIGATDQERRDRQDVLINLVLETDTRAAGRSDDINDTINYRTLNKRLIAHVEGTTFNLVEKLAEDLAALCLAEPRVGRVRVMVDGGSHNIRLMQPFPPRLKAAHGAYITDEDGHKILDFWQGHFANILGHNPRVVTHALAEAFAERLHEIVRIEWQFGRDEKLSIADMIDEKYRGIRPAPGYPALPDHTMKRTLFDLLDAENNTGIKLTESFAMHPGASVSGLYFSHPDSKYFGVGQIGRDQVMDYATRRSEAVSAVEKRLAPNLG